MNPILFLATFIGLFAPVRSDVYGQKVAMTRVLSENVTTLPVPISGNLTAYTREECSNISGIIVGDIGDGAIFEEDYICDSSGEPPLGNIVQTEEPFAIEGEVCCGPPILCDGGFPCGSNETTTPPSITVREEYTREECSDVSGIIVGDIGDGAIFQEDYVCDVTGESPLGNIVQTEEPFAIEGEVCCGPPILCDGGTPCGDEATTPTATPSVPNSGTSFATLSFIAVYGLFALGVA